MTNSSIPSSPSAIDLADALARVRSALPVTPLTKSPGLSALCGHEIWIKWDNKFHTGSFKERGAVNVLENLSIAERNTGVCAASAGNHALALSYHAQRLSIPCTIVMPLSAPLVKVTSTRNTGARVVLHGRNFDEAYEHAEQICRDEGLQFISPFDDERIIAGQSTSGQEIADQLPDADYIVVPVGGGGLLSGIGLALKHRGISAKLIGVQSEWVVEGRAGGHATSLIAPVTIADGIAVKRVGRITGPLVAALADQLVTVTEEQVAESITRILEHERTVIEGAGAAALAAVLGGCIPNTDKKVVVLACGSNIDMNVLSRLIDRDMGLHQRLLRVAISVPDRPGSLAAITRLLAEKNANVLEVLHNRAFSQIPGNVKIEFLLEVREHKHAEEVLNALRTVGLPFTA